MVKMKLSIIIIILFVILGFLFYYFKTQTKYKYHTELPEVLTEETCMEILKVYQPDINGLAFEKLGDENFTYKQVSFDTHSLFPNGVRTITFTYPNQKFEGCNIIEGYIVEKLTLLDKLTEERFKQFFDCKNLECKDIKCKGKDGRLFYTYRKINDYYELKYYMKQPTSIPIEVPSSEEVLSPEEIPTKPAMSITIQFLYFNRPLDNFIKHREDNICKENFD